MTFQEFENRFSELGGSFRTKDLDAFNKRLIKEGEDVSFLKDLILERQEYHCTYFQVSMVLLTSLEERFSFIERNFYLLQDWWHVDQLTQFIGNKVEFDFAYKKASEYIMHPHPFARRWGYVLFMPTLVKDKKNFRKIFRLLRDDDEYYVVMAEAWLLSYLAIYFPEETLDYLKTKPLKYNIVGRAIQKTCDSFRVNDETKEKFKEIRKLYK